MNRLMFSVLLTTTCLLIPLTSRHAAAAEPPPAAAKVVEPFLDEQVVGVLRIDTSRVDPKALEAWIVERLQAQAKADKSLAEKVDQTIAELARPRAQLEANLEWFRKSGARELFVLIRTAEMFQQQPPILIPMAGVTDAQALREVLPPGERIGEVMAIGEPETLQQLKALHAGKAKGAAQAELVAALGASEPDAAIHLAVALSPDGRRVFEELVPTLPPQLGGGPSSALTTGLRWITLSTKLPPQPRVRLTIQAKDADAAKALDKLLSNALTEFAKSLEAEGARQDGIQPLQKELAKLLPSLAPKTEGDRLVLLLDKEGLDKLSGTVAAAMVRARDIATRVQSSSNIRQLLQTCMLWANENRGNWPDELPAAMKAFDLPPQVAVNPAMPKTGYTYVKPDKAEKNPNRMVIYEAEPQPDGRNVGFMDGHVEWMTETSFQTALKAQQEADKKAAAGKK
jgi:prepilin-type processing-associated H-X9-DG protein